MTILVCGSLAYDNIMVFPDHFKHHILPDKVHMLNVCFTVPELRREFGGCAGNIAYNLKLLECDALPMGVVGNDFDAYADWMDSHEIDRRYVSVLDDELTAQAFITTDLDDNQITAFHPGAMNFSHVNAVTEVDDISLGIVSPDGHDGVIAHAWQFSDAGIPFIFDPGQGLPTFSKSELRTLIEQATWVTVNDYEWALLQKRTGWSQQAVTERVDALIITLGKLGSVVDTDRKQYRIPCAHASAVKDPTGCGDAYRAGLLYGLFNSMDWETTGRVASLMGTFNLEKSGTQNHDFTMDEFRERFDYNFTYRLA